MPLEEPSIQQHPASCREMTPRSIPAYMHGVCGIFERNPISVSKYTFAHMHTGTHTHTHTHTRAPKVAHAHKRAQTDTRTHRHIHRHRNTHMHIHRDTQTQIHRYSLTTDAHIHARIYTSKQNIKSSGEGNKGRGACLPDSVMRYYFMG